MSLPYGFSIPKYALRDFPDPVKGPKVTDIPATVVALFQRYYPELDESKEEQTVACPFHADDTPSMIINLPHSFYKCYACGIQGSAIDFFRRQEGIPWQEAKRTLRHLDIQQGTLVSLAEDYLTGRIQPLYLDGPALVCRKKEGDRGSMSGNHGGLCEIPLTGWARMEPYLAYLLDGAPVTVISSVIGDAVNIGTMEKVVKEAVLQLIRGVPAVSGLSRIGPGLHIHKWGPDCGGEVLMVDGRDLYRRSIGDPGPVTANVDEDPILDDLAPPVRVADTVDPSEKTNAWVSVPDVPYKDVWIPVGSPDQAWYPWKYPQSAERPSPAAVFERVFKMLASGWVWTEPVDPILCALYTLYCPIFSAWDSPPIQMHISGPSQCLDRDTKVMFTSWGPDGRRTDTRGGTIEKLYERFHGVRISRGKNRERTVTPRHYQFTAPCVGSDGRIFQNEILDVVQSGTKDCFEVKTEGGLSITASGDHKFWTGDEYVPLQKLRTGDVVMTHSRKTPERDFQSVRHLSQNLDKTLKATPTPDRVASIVYIGKRLTYDISMKAPNNNFVADGFIVHNSGKSALAAGWFGGQLSGSIGMVPGALYYTGGSEAGLRQELNYRRQLVILDELLDQDNRHSREVVEAARGLETNHGFRTLRGTRDGRARNYDVKCPIVWASINAGGMTQDVNRRINIELRRVRNPTPTEPWKAILAKWSPGYVKETARMGIEVMLDHLQEIKNRTALLYGRMRDSPSGGFRMVNRLAPLIAIADICGQPVGDIFHAISDKVGSLEGTLGSTDPVEELRVAILHTKLQFNDGLMPVFMTVGHQIHMAQPMEAPEYGVFYDPASGVLGLNPGGLLRLLRLSGHSAGNSNSVNVGRLLKDLPGYTGQARAKTRDGSYIRVTQVDASRMIASDVEIMA